MQDAFPCTSFEVAAACKVRVCQGFPVLRVRGTAVACLGGRHTDLVAGVQVHAEVGGAGDGGADGVGDAHAQRALRDRKHTLPGVGARCRSRRGSGDARMCAARPLHSKPHTH